MNKLASYCSILLDSLECKFYDRFLIYGIPPWRINDPIENLIPNEMKKGDWDTAAEHEKIKKGVEEEFEPLRACLKCFFEEIARMEKEYHVWRAAREKRLKETDYNFELVKEELPQPPAIMEEKRSHFWVEWIRVSEGLVPEKDIDLVFENDGWEMHTPVADFSMWQPFLKKYKVGNDFFWKHCGHPQDDSMLDPRGHENSTFFFNREGGMVIRKLLQTLKEYGYAREEAWSLFEPKNGYFALFYAAHASLYFQDAELAYRKHVVRHIFDGVFTPENNLPKTTKKEKPKKEKKKTK